MHCFVLLLLLCFAPAVALSQQGASHSRADDTCSVVPWRLALVGGVSTGAFVYGHVLQSDLWWKGERSDFHFDWHNDWRYALGADKLGHFFFPYVMSGMYNRAFLWSGLDTTTSLYLSSGLALAYETYVEIKDGFSAEWGFSWGDFTADALGAAFPVAQHYVPALKPYSMKISFQASEKFRTGAHSVIFDDYESTYHWISVDVAAILPPDWRSSYPPWLNIAVGHSVKQLDFRGGGTHELYLGLDWNLTALNVDGWWWDALMSVVRYYRLPAPAVRLYPGVVWYGIKL